jgi:hypothetical protein
MQAWSPQVWIPRVDKDYLIALQEYAVLPVPVISRSVSSENSDLPWMLAPVAPPGELFGDVDRNTRNVGRT